MDFPGAMVLLAGSLVLGLIFSLIYAQGLKADHHQNPIKVGYGAGFGIALTVYAGLVIMGLVENGTL